MKIIFTILCLAIVSGLRAQDVEPRIMTAAPTGTNFFGVSFFYSQGAILLDKTLPVEDLDGYTASIALSYSRYVNIFGITGRMNAVLPFAKGEWDAFVEDATEETTVQRSGLGDPRLALALFILGAPAMTADQFKKYQKKTIFGFNLRVAIPLGNYNDGRLLNLGSNRWQIVPGFALSHRMTRWTAEAYAGTWFFTKNTDFLGDFTLAQNPLYAFQIHLAYDFKPGMWLAIGMRQTAGGTTTVNGEDKDNPIENNRIGLVFGLPISSHHTLKMIATTGLATSIGTDFNTIAVQWIFR